MDTKIANARAIRESLRYPVLPQSLPIRVGIFWQLKSQRNWATLVYLHEFYGTESWLDWSLTSFDVDSDEDEPQPTATHESLQEAVEYAPEIALQELAIHLGLDYDEIEMSINDEIQTRPVTAVRTDPIKRSAPKAIATNAPKRIRRLEVPTNPGRSDEQQVRVEAPRLPLHVLLGNGTPSPGSSKDPSAQVGWGAPSPSPQPSCRSPTELATPTSVGGD